MGERNQSEVRRGQIRLVVVNETPESAKPDEENQKPSRFDPRLLDLAGIAFAVVLALFLAYVFGSLNHADKVLYCLTGGRTVCK